MKSLEAKIATLTNISEDTELMIAIRQSVLKLSDALERKVGISPTTTELRRQAKEQRYQERKQAAHSRPCE